MTSRIMYACPSSKRALKEVNYNIWPEETENIPIKPPIITRLQNTRLRTFCLFFTFSASDGEFLSAGASDLVADSGRRTCLTVDITLTVPVPGADSSLARGFGGGGGTPFCTVAVTEMLLDAGGTSAGT